MIAFGNNDENQLGLDLPQSLKKRQTKVRCQISRDSVSIDGGESACVSVDASVNVSVNVTVNVDIGVSSSVVLMLY